MMKLKHLLAAALIVCGASSVMAQETTTSQGKEHLSYPYMFVGAQGGAQLTFGDYKPLKTITGMGSVSVGAFFTPVVGARLHVSGGRDKGMFWGGQSDVSYRYKYITTDLDLMVNLVTLFGKKDYYPVNLYLIGGIGLNTAWHNDDAVALATAYSDVLPKVWDGTKLSHNGRIGLMVDWNVAKHWSVNLEVDGNSLNDRFNSKANYADDWQLTAQLGVAYKFGFKKKAKPVVVEPVFATRIDTIWYDATEYRDDTENGNKTWEVFYGCDKSDFDGQLNTTAEAQLQAIGSFLKDHKECKITIESYADVQTGNPKYNMNLSKVRSEKAVEALTKAGVDNSIISDVKYYGDTVQPYSDNNKNRVTVIKATGLKDVKVPYTVKKFRTEEVRYQVNQ